MSALEVSPFHVIALYKSTLLTYLHHYTCVVLIDDVKQLAKMTCPEFETVFERGVVKPVAETRETETVEYRAGEHAKVD